jgi:hypothetical protein
METLLGTLYPAEIHGNVASSQATRFQMGFDCGVHSNIHRQGNWISGEEFGENLGQDPTAYQGKRESCG